LPIYSFKAVLDQHQLLGFRWLCYLNEKQAGGLLADDMGVGKTAQVIALLTQLHEDHRLSPALVVLPKSLITNWMSELLSFAPTIDRIYVHADADRSRSADFLSSMNIVITTYDTARLDQVMLGGIDWTVVIADEAQFVKNPTAARTSVVKALKSKQALALTGTPVENGLIEFWCIMDYVQPGLLKSWSEFRSSYERPLVEADTGEERELLVETLLGELDPHFLRRMKEEVLRDLPPKHYQPPILVSLGDLQKRRYQEIVLAAKGAGRGAVLGAITRLLMTCAHPRASVDDWQHIAGEELIAECPKLQVTIEIVSGICRKNEKVLIFTGWKSVQRILQKAVWATFGVSAEIVNGDVTTRRQAIIDQFRAEEGFGVLILAPEVAGFGLNIIEANNVIHYTRPWNPAKENQATDRVHRRGQTKPVTVYYPTVDGTVENKLAELLSEKSQLTRDVLRPTSERTVSLDDLAEDLELKDN
ncbi:MAG: DEAD/DEAH box helicase, partial [Pseudomonadales bacterium]